MGHDRKREVEEEWAKRAQSGERAELRVVWVIGFGRSRTSRRILLVFIRLPSYKDHRLTLARASPRSTVTAVAYTLPLMVLSMNV